MSPKPIPKVGQRYNYRFNTNDVVKIIDIKNNTCYYVFDDYDSHTKLRISLDKFYTIFRLVYDDTMFIDDIKLL